MHLSPLDADEIWVKAADKVKDKIISPTLYQALEAGVGIMIEDEDFILGFSNADLPLASHLKSSRYNTIIEQAIAEVCGKNLNLKIVEGTTPEEYYAYKEFYANAEKAKNLLTQQRERDRSIEREWEAVGEQISRGYAKIPNRNFPQARAMYLMEAYKMLNEACIRFNYTDESEEMHKRGLARVFEKIAHVMELPSTIIAFQFFRLKEDGKL
ncbi:MAG: hypothetical protein SNJ70_01355 [Armatimonadota bacterium]